jgi:XRE family aerobic/anaerobic benzoate catabolism transcriptional regulator
MTVEKSLSPEPRRGTSPAAEEYLRLVGGRVRVMRAQRGMSRKVLSEASGVSERYLAELERGAGNASLLVLRDIAAAMSIPVADLVTDAAEPSIDLKLATHQLARLSTDELRDAREWLTSRFGPRYQLGRGRIALIGLRGAGKTTIGERAAAELKAPFIELDREIERAAGMDLAEIFSVHGQAVFRRLEFECLEAAVRTYDRSVIATGGSLVTEPATFDLLLSTCFVVWLKAPPEEHMARVKAQGDLRPMSASRRAMDDLKSILESRAELYARADAEIDTARLSIDEARTALVALVTEVAGN